MRSLSCALWITLIVVVALNGILMKMFIDTMNESNRLASEKTDRVLLELTRLVEKPLPYWMDDIYTVPGRCKSASTGWKWKILSCVVRNSLVDG